MKAKRAIKLLMAMGYTRNEAIECIAYFRNQDRSLYGVNDYAVWRTVNDEREEIARQYRCRYGSRSIKAPYVENGEWHHMMLEPYESLESWLLISNKSTNKHYGMLIKCLNTLWKFYYDFNVEIDELSLYDLLERLWNCWDSCKGLDKKIESF